MSLPRLALLAAFCCCLFWHPAPAARAAEPRAAYPPLSPDYTSIKVFDRQGRFIGRILPEGRYWVGIDRVPVFLQKALVAIEDARFYDHPGVDIRGIARALVKDVAQGRLAEGGSTITQQLVKNKHLSAEKTLDRKVREGLLAIEYEKKYSKQQILEMYFNEVYFGNGAWGIAQAARLYYDKNPEDLNEAECAVLAGVPKNPGRYNPWENRADVEQRRNTVLARMAELQLIPPRQLEKLRSQPAPAIPRGQAPQYLVHVRRKLVEQYGPQIIERGGLDVRAALDLHLQKLAEQTLREGVQRISPELQGALLCLDPHTGDILAVAGGVDFPKNTFNRAFFARRQPGSAIKPLIYAAALNLGITASSRWDDTPATYSRGYGRSWTPRNYGGNSYGSPTLREALAHSSNVVTVKLLDTIGVPYFVEFARKLGLVLPAPGDLSLALGTAEVSLHDLALAYTPLATGGLRPESRTILRVYERNRKAWTENAAVVTPVLDPATAFVTTRMLQDVLTYGTAKSLNRFALERPAAGKTGTTDAYRDAWFIGYTPQMITGVWVGHDQPKAGGNGFTGGAVAAPIWERFMRQALAGEPPLDFTQPEAVVSAAIDPLTGDLATAGCPLIQEEFYLHGSEPTQYCREHGSAPAESAPVAEPGDLPPEWAGAEPPGGPGDRD